MIILDWIMQKINALMRDKGHSITYTVPRDIVGQLAYNHFLTSGVINLETHYAESAQAHHRTGGDVEIIVVIKERETPPPPPPPAEKTTPPPTENNNQSDNTPSQKSL